MAKRNGRFKTSWTPDASLVDMWSTRLSGPASMATLQEYRAPGWLAEHLWSLLSRQACSLSTSEITPWSWIHKQELILEIAQPWWTEHEWEPVGTSSALTRKHHEPSFAQSPSPSPHPNHSFYLLAAILQISSTIGSPGSSYIRTNLSTTDVPIHLAWLVGLEAQTDYPLLRLVLSNWRYFILY